MCMQLTANQIHTAFFIRTIKMGKIDLFPAQSFSSVGGLTARSSRNGVVISTEKTTTKKLRSFPSVADELAVVKQCLAAARRLWASWSVSYRTTWATQARLYCVPRFPAPSGEFSDFNLFYSQYSAYWYGNYYNNGALTYFDGTTWQPFYHNSFVEPEYNRIYEPNPAIIGQYWYISNNLSIQDAPILDITNETFNFRLDFNFPAGTPSFFWNWFIFFNWANTQAGWLFYISNPGADAGLSFARGNRLLIATYKPNSVSSTGASFYPVTFMDFKGPLAKYYDLSVLDLIVGMKVKITAFMVSSYGQCLPFGEFTSEII